MNLSSNRKNIYFTFAIISFIIIFIWLLQIGIFSLLVPVLWALFFAYLLNPMVNVLERFRIKRVVAIILVYLFLSVLIWLGVVYIMPGVIKDLTSLLGDIPGYANRLMKIVDGFKLKLDHSNIPDGFSKIIDQNINRAEKYAVNFVESILNSFTHIFTKVFDISLIPIITFYLLKDARELRSSFAKTLPTRYRKSILSTLNDMNIVVARFVRSELLVGFFIAIITAVALSAFKVKFALFLGIVAGVGEIIPYFGPLLSGIPAILLAYIDSPMKALWVFLVMSLIQQVEGNIISPMIIGDNLGLHPLVVMFAVIIGGKYFGIIGMLLSVPAACIARILIIRLTKNISFS